MSWFVQDDRIRMNLAVPTLVQFIIHLERAFNSLNPVIRTGHHQGGSGVRDDDVVKRSLSVGQFDWAFAHGENKGGYRQSHRSCGEIRDVSL